MAFGKRNFPVQPGHSYAVYLGFAECLGKGTRQTSKVLPRLLQKHSANVKVLLSVTVTWPSVGHAPTFFCRGPSQHSEKSLQSARQKTLGKELFAVRSYTVSCLSRAAHCKHFAMCFLGFAECLRHLAKQLNPVVKLGSDGRCWCGRPPVSCGGGRGARGTLGLALAALLEQHPPRVGGGGRTGEWLLRRLELHGRLRSTAEDGRWLSLLRRSCMQFDISFQNGNFIHEFD